VNRRQGHTPNWVSRPVTTRLSGHYGHRRPVSSGACLRGESHPQYTGTAPDGMGCLNVDPPKYDLIR
jgi:hypothetical protein